MRFALPLVSCLWAVSPLAASILHVGAAAEFPFPSAAAAAAHDGDTILIGSGEYRGDVAVWKANRLRILGENPRPHILADGRNASGKGLWVVQGDDAQIENVELSGARVPDHNGAALRIEGRNFTLRGCYLHDNEDGLLAGANAASEITVERCELARNGDGKGQTHNLYVGQVGKLTVTGCYFHHAIGGHQLKSRAAESIVTHSRLADETDGQGSYAADFPNGGRVFLASDVFQKGSAAENATSVSYGAEGLAAGGVHELVVKDSAFLSQRERGSLFLFIAPGVKSAALRGNVFAGRGALPDLPGLAADNVIRPDGVRGEQR